MDIPLKKDGKEVLIILSFKGTTKEFRAELETEEVNLDWVSVAGFGKDLKTLGKENVVMCCLGDLYRPGVDKITVEKDLKDLGIDIEQLQNVQEIYISGHGNKGDKTAGYGQDVEASYFAQAIPSLLNTFGMNQVTDIIVGCCYGNNNKGGSSICKSIAESIQSHKNIKVKGFQGKAVSAGNRKMYGISPEKEISDRSGILEEKLTNLYGFDQIDQECRTRLKQIKSKSDQEFWLWLKQIATNYTNCSQINDFYNKFDQLNYDLGYVNEELVDNQIRSPKAPSENDAFAQLEKIYSKLYEEYDELLSKLMELGNDDEVVDYICSYELEKKDEEVYEDKCSQKVSEYLVEIGKYKEKLNEYNESIDKIFDTLFSSQDFRKNFKNEFTPEDVKKLFDDADLALKVVGTVKNADNLTSALQTMYDDSEIKQELEKQQEVNLLAFALEKLNEIKIDEKEIDQQTKRQINKLARETLEKHLNKHASSSRVQDLKKEMIVDMINTATNLVKSKQKTKELQEGNSLGSPSFPPKGGGSGGNSSKDNDNDDNAPNNGGSSLSRSIGTNTNEDTSNATKQQEQKPGISKQEGLTEIVANYQTITEVIKRIGLNNELKADLPDSLLEAVEEELNKITDPKARHEVDKKALVVFRKTLGGGDPKIYDFESDKMRNAVTDAQEVIKKVKELTMDHERSLERELEQKQNHDFTPLRSKF